MKLLRDNYKSIFFVGVEIITLAWTSIMLVLDLMGLIQKNPKVETITFFSFVIFAILVYVHIFSLRKQLSPKIDLVFGNDPACRHIFQNNKGDFSTLFRVGLINSGGKTIDNIRVSLEQIEPEGITYGPIPLRFMHEKESQGEFRLHPSKRPSLFVDVIQDVFISSTGRMLNFPYAVKGVPNNFPLGTYCLTLVAEGRDVPPTRRNFQVSWNGENLEFRKECNPVN